jgi:hypothetical protein
LSAKQRRKQSILGVSSILSHTTAINNTAAITHKREREGEKRARRDESRSKKKKLCSASRSGKGNFCSLIAPKNELAAGKQNTFIIIAKEEEEEEEDKHLKHLHRYLSTYPRL